MNIMPNKKIILIFNLVLVTIFLPANSSIDRNLSNYDILSGNIDSNYFKKFSDLSKKNKPIILSSGGGSAIISLEISKKIKEKSPKIHIAGLCLSACAEIILPSSIKYSKSRLLNYPLIGYHQNSEIYKLSLTDKYIPSYNKCFGSLNKKFIEFRKSVGIEYNSIYFQMNAIQPDIKNTYILENCENSNIKIKRSYWFPTSFQIKKIFGIPILDPVCADESKCFEAVLPVMGDIGEIYLVGENEYIVDRKISGGKKLSFIKKVDLSNREF